LDGSQDICVGSRRRFVSLFARDAPAIAVPVFGHVFKATRIGDMNKLAVRITAPEPRMLHS
jgi:hypothetical protein